MPKQAKGLETKARSWLATQTASGLMNGEKYGAGISSIMPACLMTMMSNKIQVDWTSSCTLKGSGHVKQCMPRFTAANVAFP